MEYENAYLKHDGPVSPRPVKCLTYVKTGNLTSSTFHQPLLVLIFVKLPNKFNSPLMTC